MTINMISREILLYAVVISDIEKNNNKESIGEC